MVIQYSVSADTPGEGSYEFPGNGWVGNVAGGTGSVFGYSDDTPTLTFVTQALEPEGAPSAGTLGLAVLTLLLLAVAAVRGRVLVAKIRVSR